LEVHQCWRGTGIFDELSVVYSLARYIDPSLSTGFGSYCLLVELNELCDDLINILAFVKHTCPCLIRVIQRS